MKSQNEFIRWKASLQNQNTMEENISVNHALPIQYILNNEKQAWKWIQS